MSYDLTISQMFQSSFFDVEKILITAEQRLSKEEFQNVENFEFGKNHLQFFKVKNEEQISEIRLCSNLPKENMLEGINYCYACGKKFSIFKKRSQKDFCICEQCMQNMIEKPQQNNDYGDLNLKYLFQVNKVNQPEYMKLL